MRGHSGHTGRYPFRVALAAISAVFLVACGGDADPTAPPDPPPPTPGSLAIGVESARPNELVTLRPTGLDRALPDTVTGTIGTEDFRAIRLDDSTLVGLVPAGVTGAQTVSFDLYDRPYTAELVVLEPIVVMDPATTATALFDKVLARFDSVEVALASGETNGVDTTAVRSFLTASREAITQAREQFLALSAEEQGAAIPYIVAEAAAVGLEVDATTSEASNAVVFPFVGAGSGGPYSASLCTALTSFESCARISETGSAIRSAAREIAVCSAKTLGTSALGGVIGGAVGGSLGFLLGGVGAAPGAIAGIKNGAAIGAGVGLAWCMGDVWDKLTGVYDAAVNPVVVSVDEVFNDVRTPGARVSATAATEGATFTSGVATKVDVYVDFRSLSTGDASGPPVLASLVEEFEQLAGSWDEIREKFSFMDIPPITLPATPRVSIRKKVPGSHLSVMGVSPEQITATGAGDEQWMVTFTNPAQGDDHPFSYTVRFSYPDFPDQDRARSGTLRPSRYVVAGLTLTPAADTVPVGEQITFEWTASDSSGDVLTDSLLAGRKPTWKTSAASIATVGTTSGTVTGVSGGTAGITAELESGSATSDVLVVPDITGTYTLVTENGVTVPGVTYEDSIYSIVTTSGSVTLRADGTFSYVRSATGTNLATNMTYDEGGSGGGTYTVNATGTAITFETIEQDGVPITFGSGSVGGDILTIGVQTPEGGGSATLRKQP
jgi:hypothetical protein